MTLVPLKINFSVLLVGGLFWGNAKLNTGSAGVLEMVVLANHPITECRRISLNRVRAGVPHHRISSASSATVRPPMVDPIESSGRHESFVYEAYESVKLP